MHHDGGDRPAHAERRDGYAAARAKTRDGPEAPILVEETGRLEMFGNAVDARAVANQNRRFADLVLATTNVPGASIHDQLSRCVCA
jgi:hypothetical protein